MIDQLQHGDTVLVHSSFGATGLDNPQALLRDLRDALGEDGTLIAPTFTLKFFERGETFDPYKTPSEMGILSELVRRGGVRTIHPLYSFAAMGKRQDDVAAITAATCYGADTVFQKLRDWGGKILIIGLEWNHSFTFAHHIEEMNGVDWREHVAKLGYIANGAETFPYPFTIYARKDGVKTNVNPLGARFECEGLAHVGAIGNARAMLIDANAAFDAASQWLDTPELFCERGKG